MGKFTPGPWIAMGKDEPTRNIVHIKHKTEIIAFNVEPKNAHLIAAAPEMLEVLIEIKRRMSEVKGPINWGIPSLIDAALAKARGE